MTSDELAERLLGHADWMVSSGQFCGTVRTYLGFLHPSPDRDEALRRLTERERLEAAGGAADERNEEERSDGDDD